VVVDYLMMRRLMACREAAYLRRTLKSFEKIVSRGEIPKTYLTERGILFSLKELDEWLMRKTLPQDT
jgi:hypothetical protein